tara:strand:- start:664 stop:1194 length:531 start_codon:yes stop_codon:yes gene_type:complete
MNEIEKDLRSWSVEVLEVPNHDLKGLSPCPYAKNAWEKDKVLVIQTDDIFAESLRQCSDMPLTDKELIVVASYDIPEIDKFNKYVQNLNILFDTLHCMEFHPDYGAEDADLDFLYENDWESSLDKPYCMVFIQDLEQVVLASDKLQTLGYYDVYPDEEYEELVVNRKRRLTNGYET